MLIVTLDTTHKKVLASYFHTTTTMVGGALLVILEVSRERQNNIMGSCTPCEELQPHLSPLYGP